MNRADRRRQAWQDPPPHRRERTQAEQEACLTRVLDKWGNTLAEIAWHAYQQGGRGMVVWYQPSAGHSAYLRAFQIPAFLHLMREEILHASTLTRQERADYVRDLDAHEQVVLAEVAHYEPTHEYVLYFTLSQTGDFWQQRLQRVITVWPPFTAPDGPFLVQRADEHGH